MRRNNTYLPTILILSMVLQPIIAFEFPSLPSFWKPTTSSSSSPLLTPSLSQKKATLLERISNTANGKTASLERQSEVLSIVRDIETTYPPDENLLSDPDVAKILDGVWYLQYTSPSEITQTNDNEEEDTSWKPINATEGPSNIETRQFRAKGSVSAVGITVDTSRKTTQQIFDISKQTISNEVEQDFGIIKVSGTFRQSGSVPTRAVVSFRELDLMLNVGVTLRLGFLFGLIGVVRGGKRENGWLETTFVDKDVRIGRGNKGTMFVLTRDPEAVLP